MSLNALTIVHLGGERDVLICMVSPPVGGEREGEREREREIFTIIQLINQNLNKKLLLKAPETHED